ncbi:hypothetical protein HELRODRAFT_162369 [Helobdella robusta]|uniref:Uncharacterized protein n=1 Tax=Helobdella robusta TaxID=6412 RepID=T1ESK8_HELRO|nr:hypothetical protein HELRODRAFT_162369 [Helobdella robusta]ESN98902.1 hypothetical protein HELRODRAFT_162369 [Helobdella robusta]
MDAIMQMMYTFHEAVDEAIFPFQIKLAAGLACKSLEIIECYELLPNAVLATRLQMIKTNFILIFNCEAFEVEKVFEGENGENSSKQSKYYSIIFSNVSPQGCCIHFLVYETFVWKGTT